MMRALSHCGALTDLLLPSMAIDEESAVGLSVGLTLAPHKHKLLVHAPWKTMGDHASALCANPISRRWCVTAASLAESLPFLPSLCKLLPQPNTRTRLHCSGARSSCRALSPIGEEGGNAIPRANARCVSESCARD